MINVAKCRRDFPILARRVNDKPLVYLDNAATTQKPIPVIESINTYYREYNANIHRGLHTLSELATTAYESAREKIAQLINAPSSAEIIFTRSTTESINLVAHAWARKFLRAGDVVLLTEMEHHSNLVPWQILREQRDIELRFIPVTPEGILDLSTFDNLVENARLVSVTHISNVLGTINPVAEIGRRAHAAGALLLVDGAQSAPHVPVDVQSLDGDFFAFSGHKMCGPTGIGVLWGRTQLLEAMDPFLGGGDMIHEVFFDHATYAALPNKFEAGTPNIVGGIGLGAAVDYLTGVGMDNILAHDQEITRTALAKLSEVPGLRIFGNAPQRSSVITFELEGVHPHDLSTILDQDGIAIRAGHHCAQPLLRKFGVQSTARASFYFYNDLEEIDMLIKGIQKAREIFGYVA